LFDVVEDAKHSGPKARRFRSESAVRKSVYGVLEPLHVFSVRYAVAVSIGVQWVGSVLDLQAVRQLIVVGIRIEGVSAVGVDFVAVG